MDFKGTKGDHFPILLPRRSLVIMLGPSRYLYTHGIMPRKSDVVTVQSGFGDTLTQRLTLSLRDTRTSFTFRILRRGPCHCRTLSANGRDYANFTCSITVSVINTKHFGSKIIFPVYIVRCVNFIICHVQNVVSQTVFSQMYVY